MTYDLLRDADALADVVDAPIAVPDLVRPTQRSTPRPTPVQAAPAEAPAQPEPAGFGDVPPVVWRLFILSWLAFLGVLWAAFGGSAESAFAVAVATFFAAMYFATPGVVLRLVRQPSGQKHAGGTPVRREVETLTGPLSVASAAVQMLVLPVGLTVGMAVIALVIR